MRNIRSCIAEHCEFRERLDILPKQRKEEKGMNRKKRIKRVAAMSLAVLLAVSLLAGCRSSGIKIKKDKKGFYDYDGYIIKADYPLDEKSLNQAGEKLRHIYDLYLDGKDVKTYFAIVPDKNAWAYEPEGQNVINYSELYARMQEETKDFASYVELDDLLSMDCYYKTDAHWRQEKIDPVAQRVAQAMGCKLTADYDEVVANAQFVGAYGRQSNLTMEAEKLIYLTNATLDGCIVTDYETGDTIAIYDTAKAASEDGEGYDLFLYGSKSLLTIENPASTTDKELVIFRDSFGSSLAPYFAECYRKITLVDTRYLASELVGRFVEFDDQDVLFLYSTPVLNNSVILK